MKLRSCLLLAAVGALLNLGISGCGNSEEFVFTQGAVVNPNVPPIANLDNYLSVGNAPLSIPAARGVLANDEPNGGNISSFDISGTEGAVQLQDDGSFTYEPPFGYTGSDTFTYTLSNAAGESSTTVTINIQNLAFFVDNTAPDGGNGSFNSRFNQISQATAAAGPNDFIAVFRGDGISGLSAATLESTGTIDLTWTDNSILGGKEMTVRAFDGSQIEGEIRGNTGNDIRVATVETTAEMCAAITDNTSDELVIEESAGTLGVERLDVANGGPLQTVNTITAGVATIIGTPVGLMPNTCLGSLID